MRRKAVKNMDTLESLPCSSIFCQTIFVSIKNNLVLQIKVIAGTWVENRCAGTFERRCAVGQRPNCSVVDDTARRKRQTSPSPPSNLWWKTVLANLFTDDEIVSIQFQWGGAYSQIPITTRLLLQSLYKSIWKMDMYIIWSSIPSLIVDHFTFSMEHSFLYPLSSVWSSS